MQFIFKHLITHLHQFVRDTDITDEEWMSAIQFLTRVGQTCSPIRQEMILLSDVLGVSALVDEMNNPAIEGATVSSVLGPFFTEDAPDGMYCSVHECYRAAGVTIEFSVDAGGSIASEGSGEYLFVEGYVRSTTGEPIAGAVIDTWETDADGETRNIYCFYPLFTTLSSAQGSMTLKDLYVTSPTSEAGYAQTRMVNIPTGLLFR